MRLQITPVTAQVRLGLEPRFQCPKGGIHQVFSCLVRSCSLVPKGKVSFQNKIDFFLVVDLNETSSSMLSFSKFFVFHFKNAWLYCAMLKIQADIK